ncbi:hypothetical protein [Haloglycomyces albus]|uniref:hypothetical protein n=1 Tax=Haloglycomyces albus TaxID=526067 RepID=UPI00046CE5A7|nr:hypothetical protein [Haloglycomyces albus]
MLIGLTGYARTGKTTVADILVRDYGYEHRAFASKLKQILREMNPTIGYHNLDELLSDGEEHVKRYPEYRRYLQRLGHACRRHLGATVWIDALVRDWNPSADTVISDVRYLNEADAIRQRGGFIVRVTREGVGPANSHDSETELAEIDHDFELGNNSDASGIAQDVVGMLAVLKSRRWR